MKLIMPDFVKWVKFQNLEQPSRINANSSNVRALLVSLKSVSQRKCKTQAGVTDQTSCNIDSISLATIKELLPDADDILTSFRFTGTAA